MTLNNSGDPRAFTSLAIVTGSWAQILHIQTEDFFLIGQKVNHLEITLAHLPSASETLSILLNPVKGPVGTPFKKCKPILCPCSWYKTIPPSFLGRLRTYHMNLANCFLLHANSYLASTEPSSLPPVTEDVPSSFLQSTLLLEPLPLLRPPSHVLLPSLSPGSLWACFSILWHLLVITFIWNLRNLYV